ncbi:cob(I)yrinic acid a,c-diamide adenosyltransferase [Desulfococcaceae bacterium HSG8]|nr:cob(I)yrinic acid a,c-diamide adenosyltransferase [Desulfococcaceae bacterium HSG8]
MQANSVCRRQNRSFAFPNEVWKRGGQTRRQNKGKLMEGYVHVYTGNGKGKTTAALGLAVRSAGAGLKVFIAQFIKNGDYSEIKALRRLSDFITVEQFGLGRFINGKPSPADIEAVRSGLGKVKSVISSGEYSVVILDEANIAVKYDIFSEQELLDIIGLKSENTELVITGRDASPNVIEKADLVTEMKELKHYFQKGVQARVGIEK